MKNVLKDFLGNFIKFISQDLLALIIAPIDILVCGITLIIIRIHNTDDALIDCYATLVDGFEDVLALIKYSNNPIERYSIWHLKTYIAYKYCSKRITKLTKKSNLKEQEA